MQQLSVFLTFFIALTVMGIGLLVSRRSGYRFPYGRAVLLIWIGSALIGLTMYILRWQTKTAARFLYGNGRLCSFVLIVLVQQLRRSSRLPDD